MNIVFHVPELSRSIPCLNNVKNYLKLRQYALFLTLRRLKA